MIELEGEEFNLEACIQFTLLQKILIKMAKREKEMEHKIEYLEKKLNNNDQRFENIEKNILNLSEHKPITTTIIEKVIEKAKSEDEEEIELDDKIDDNINQINKKKEYKEKDDKEKEPIQSSKKEKSFKAQNSYDEKEENEDEKKTERKDERKVTFKKEKTELKDINENDEKDTFSTYQNINNDTMSEFAAKSDTQDIEIERIISSLPNNFGLENKLNESNEKYKLKTFPELLTLFNKRIHACEKGIKELQRVSKIHNLLNNNINKNKDNIEENHKEIESIKKNIHDIEIRAKQSKNEMDQIRVKVEDFNIYDLVKDSGDGNLDASKVLIMALEKKVFKKFEQNDEKYKVLDEDVTKFKNDFNDLINNFDSLKKKIEFNEPNEEIHNEFNEYKEKMTDYLTNLSNRINSLGTVNVNEVSNVNNTFDEEKVKNLLNDSLNELENKIMSNIKENIEETKKKILENHNSSMEDTINMIKNLSKKIKEIDKTLEQKVNDTTVNEMNEKIKKIEEELKQKTNQYTFEELNDKVTILDEKSKDTDFKMEQINELADKLRQENSNIVRKIEYLTGEYAKLAYGPVSETTSNKRKSIFDTSNFIDSQKFIETTKIIHKKLDFLKSNIDTIQKNIDDIFERLKSTPNEDDFIQYQNLLKSMIEDLRLSCNKKYSDKIDVQKSFRYIETQIKNLNENYKREGESWLLAKKPLSNFLCASCESVIRDMNTKNEYIPWNKYPQREENATKYRMGHGFSRMLQMVNTDLLRSQENKDKNYTSDDEKMNNLNELNKTIENKKVRLPYVSQRGNTNSLNVDSNSSLIGGKNNSGSINKSVVLNSNNNNNSNINNNNNYSGNETINNESNQPKVVRIYKVNKNNQGNEGGDIGNLYNKTDPSL